GHAQHKEKGKAADEAVKAHEDYREEVHKHFQQTSQIMSRMVDDYREMYQHLSAGAGKLANIHPERVITPPPAPEAITAQDPDDDAQPTAADPTPATAEPGAAADTHAPGPAGDDAAPAQDTAGTADTPAQGATDTPQVDEAEKARARRLSGNAV